MPEETEILYGPLYGVSPELLEDAWKPAFELLKKAVDRQKLWDYYTEEDLYSLVESRDIQLWVAVADGEIKAAFLTEISEYPRRKVFDIFLVGGSDLDTWVLPAWGTFKAFARSHECAGIRGFGRKGWTRLLEEKDIQYSVLWDVDL